MGRKASQFRNDMATQHLDLDEQEQLAQLKDFWKKWGNPLTWVIIVSLGAYGAWLGYQNWENRRATQASSLYEEFDKAVQAGDAALVGRALSDLSDKYESTAYAQQARLMAAKFYYDKGNLEGAKAALQALVDKAQDEGYQAIGRLRLAGLLADQKNYDAALATLAAPMPKPFEALAMDRRADIFALQGKAEQARSEYLKAYGAIDETAPLRRLVEIKMRALGAEPPAAKASEPQPGS
jgi:predicted negative regulator of RcsB-dependent stress response